MVDANKAYESWKNFCDKADEDVKSFDGKKHEQCPCCGHEARAFWNYDGDYDVHFIIECTNCSCRVKSYSWESCLDEWEGHRIPQKLDNFFIVHATTRGPQGERAEDLSIFTDVDGARAYIKKSADNFKHMENFKLSDDEFTCNSKDGKWFYRVWIEPVQRKASA